MLGLIEMQIVIYNKMIDTDIDKSRYIEIVTNLYLYLSTYLKGNMLSHFLTNNAVFTRRKRSKIKAGNPAYATLLRLRSSVLIPSVIRHADSLELHDMMKRSLFFCDPPPQNT